MPTGTWHITFAPVDNTKPIEPIDIDWSVEDDLRSIPLHVAATYGAGDFNGNYAHYRQGGDITRDGEVVATWHVERR